MKSEHKEECDCATCQKLGPIIKETLKKLDPLSTQERALILGRIHGIIVGASSQEQGLMFEAWHFMYLQDAAEKAKAKVEELTRRN